MKSLSNHNTSSFPPAQTSLRPARSCRPARGPTTPEQTGIPLFDNSDGKKCATIATSVSMFSSTKEAEIQVEKGGFQEVGSCYAVAGRLRRPLQTAYSLSNMCWAMLCRN